MTGRPDPLESALRSAWNQGEPVDPDEPLVLPADPDQPVPYTVVADDAGKDTRDGNQPPAGASTLSSDVLDLLTAIRDHVNVPLPSLDTDDERAWHVLMARRLSDLHTSLSVAVDPQWADTTNAAAEAAHIRHRTAATPVTFTRYDNPEQAAGGEA